MRLDVIDTVDCLVVAQGGNDELEERGRSIFKQLDNPDFSRINLLQEEENVIGNVPVRDWLLERLFKDHLTPDCPHLQEVRTPAVMLLDCLIVDLDQDGTKV